MAKLLEKFELEQDDLKPFFQKNPDGSFTFSNGKEGMIFSLTNEEVALFLKGKYRVVLDEE